MSNNSCDEIFSCMHYYYCACLPHVFRFGCTHKRSAWVCGRLRMGMAIGVVWMCDAMTNSRFVIHHSWIAASWNAHKAYRRKRIILCVLVCLPSRNPLYILYKPQYVRYGRDVSYVCHYTFFHFFIFILISLKVCERGKKIWENHSIFLFSHIQPDRRSAYIANFLWAHRCLKWHFFSGFLPSLPLFVRLYMPCVRNLNHSVRVYATSAWLQLQGNVHTWISLSASSPTLSTDCEYTQGAYAYTFTHHAYIQEISGIMNHHQST